MKYIEELKPGEAFVFENFMYILTSDFKRSGDRLAINVQTGFPKWFALSVIVNKTDLYMLVDSNFTPIKPRSKDDLD